LGVVAGGLGLLWALTFWAPGFKTLQIGFFVIMLGMVIALVWQLFVGIIMIRKRTTKQIEPVVAVQQS
jgi:ABC-type proline/glycine betaine transport system permease subunit